MSCQQVPTTPAFNPYPRSVQVGEFEVAIGGGIWVAIRVAASLVLAPARIAVASGTAFLLSQWLDISVFDRLRHGTWWRAPLVATLLAAVLDTAVFWSIAFAGTSDPWVTWALGDLAVKLVLGMLLLLPFRLLIGRRAAERGPA